MSHEEDVVGLDWLRVTGFISLSTWTPTNIEQERDKVISKSVICKT
jgi:hypothetical protein